MNETVFPDGFPSFWEKDKTFRAGWHFQPSDWFPNDPNWYGSILNSMTKQLFMYSPSHATKAEALAAADEWEKVAKR